VWWYAKLSTIEKSANILIFSGTGMYLMIYHGHFLEKLNNKIVEYVLGAKKSSFPWFYSKYFCSTKKRLSLTQVLDIRVWPFRQFCLWCPVWSPQSSNKCPGIHYRRSLSSVTYVPLRINVYHVIYYTKILHYLDVFPSSIFVSRDL